MHLGDPPCHISIMERNPLIVGQGRPVPILPETFFVKFIYRLKFVHKMNFILIKNPVKSIPGLLQFNRMYFTVIAQCLDTCPVPRGDLAVTPDHPVAF